MELIWGLFQIMVWAVTMLGKGVAIVVKTFVPPVAGPHPGPPDVGAGQLDQQDGAIGAQGGGRQPARQQPQVVPGVEVDDRRYAPADRIYHVAFPRGFSAKVYVYKARGEVTRVLSTTDASISRKLEYAFMSSRIPLKTLSLRDHSIEDILRDTEVKGAEAINKALSSLRKIRQFELPEAASTPSANAAAQSLAADTSAVGAESHTTGSAVAKEEQPGPAAGTEVSSRLARKGVAITGIVLSAQNKETLFNTAGRKTKGTTFEVTLDTAAGETSMRGVVLRDEYTRLGVKPGDHVSITPLGRQKVVDGENDKGFMKNMFKVELLNRTAA